MTVKHLEAEYIESGTFQGAGEDVSKAGIKYGDDVVVLSKEAFRELMDVVQCVENWRAPDPSPETHQR